MNTAEIATLFDYNYWANGRVLNAASRVTPAQFVAPAGLSHGSVRGALVHVLSAEVVWRLRCQEGISPPAMLLETGFPTLDSLREFWNEEEQAMRAYLAGLFANLGKVTADSPADFATLRAEHSTPGGLNEQIFRDFAAGGGTAALTAALDRVLVRVRGQTG